MAESLDKTLSYENRHAEGAGNRLAKILEQARPKWMGRTRPIPGDPPLPSRQQAELAQVRAALVEALVIIDRLTR